MKGTVHTTLSITGVPDSDDDANDHSDSEGIGRWEPQAGMHRCLYSMDSLTRTAAHVNVAVADRRR